MTDDDLAVTLSILRIVKRSGCRVPRSSVAAFPRFVVAQESGKESVPDWAGGGGIRDGLEACRLRRLTRASESPEEFRKLPEELWKGPQGFWTLPESSWNSPDLIWKLRPLSQTRARHSRTPLSIPWAILSHSRHAGVNTPAACARFLRLRRILQTPAP